MDVFVSRPTWVAAEFEAGLAAFLRVLRSLDLTPRTLGATDYPSKAPLDEVIALMGKCAGAVILGYPQLVVETGHLKGVPINQALELPTEWNHIEAGLAYARELPLLVIHHRGVRRGIFDRGATNEEKRMVCRVFSANTFAEVVLLLQFIVGTHIVVPRDSRRALPI